MANFMEKLDTPALVVDVKKMEQNLAWGQNIADNNGVNLRPHTKTHKTPELAQKQIEMGAIGITVAKLGEAEIMANEGIKDIFIANEIYGSIKMKRLKELANKARIAIGVDHLIQAQAYSEEFKDESIVLEVLIDIDTGDARTGVRPGVSVLDLAQKISQLPGISLKGIFAHEGHCYGANTLSEANDMFVKSQKDMLMSADLLINNGFNVQVISIGATPPLLSGGKILKGITEIRPGTYIFMDAAQANIIGNFDHCALTVLGTVVNRPTPDRVIIDTGVKALTAYVRGKGICQTTGYGRLKIDPQIIIESLSDEHGVINNTFGRELKIGEKVEIIPNHVCPVCNLYETIYGVTDDQVVAEWQIKARGKNR